MKTVPQLCSTFSIDPSLTWQNEIVVYVWYALEVKNVKMFLDIEKLTLSILSFQNFFFNSLQSLLPYSELLGAEYLEPGEKKNKIKFQQRKSYV